MSPREFLGEVYARDRVLALTGWGTAALFVALLAVAPFDGRTVTGLNPWVKPLKFCLSVTAYVWTLAWFVGHLRTRWARLVSWGTALVFAVEMACLVSQAARGVTSHYNVRTPYDAAVFSLMGLMIAFNTLLVGVTLALFFFRVARPLAPAYLWGVRLGLLLFFLGSLEGMAMVSNMAHTVGAPDGGPGLPFVNWSTRSGDLRVAHFLAFHALQLLPLAGYALGRLKPGWPGRRQVAAVFALALLYSAAVSLVFWQALAGRPLLGLG
ncbi:MAG TPA: hypothetical protein VF668_19905 [Pyrinomonadaceae bacterium]